MVFCFVQKFFFGQHELEYFFLSRKARNFFPDINIRLYDKNCESDYFFFLHQNQNIFLEKKHNPPPFKLNRRSLMAFHPDKCNVLTITKKRNPIKFNYTLLGHSLEHVTSVKYLGCTITSDLKWGPHINNICNKALYHRLPQE